VSLGGEVDATFNVVGVIVDDVFPVAVSFPLFLDLYALVVFPEDTTAVVKPSSLSLACASRSDRLVAFAGCIIMAWVSKDRIDCIRFRVSLAMSLVSADRSELMLAFLLGTCSEFTECRRLGARWGDAVPAGCVDIRGCLGAGTSIGSLPTRDRRRVVALGAFDAFVVEVESLLLFPLLVLVVVAFVAAAVVELVVTAVEEEESVEVEVALVLGVVEEVVCSSPLPTPLSFELWEQLLMKRAAASSFFRRSSRRRIVEFQWFFTELSVRPGSNLAISAHLFPNTPCASRIVLSSS